MDLSPEWLEKKSFVSGTQDGTVKQWIIQKDNDKIKIKDPQCHEFHKTASEVSIKLFYVSLYEFHKKDIVNILFVGGSLLNI